MAVYLASDEAWTSGGVFAVDGGYTAGREAISPRDGRQARGGRSDWARPTPAEEIGASRAAPPSVAFGDISP